MDSQQILLLGLGYRSPLETAQPTHGYRKRLHELHLEIKAERSAKYACPGMHSA